jgi:hypothetical protein
VTRSRGDQPRSVWRRATEAALVTLAVLTLLFIVLVMVVLHVAGPD